MKRDPNVIKLATRGSKLALAQSGRVAGMIEALNPGVRVVLHQVTTSGDLIRGPLSEHGGKGLFTKEIERALLDGRADVAVHSFKDVPVTMPLIHEAADLLTIAAVPTREDVRDVLIHAHENAEGWDHLGDDEREEAGLKLLEPGYRVGTSSPRRAALVKDWMQNWSPVELRGNVDTRLAKMKAGEVDAILLARAGLMRLGLSESFNTHVLDPAVFVPAAGQGALAVQCRADDGRTRERLAKLDDARTRRCVTLERAVVEALDGDCHSPIGAWADGPIGGKAVLQIAWERDGMLQRVRAVADGNTLPDDLVAQLRG